MIIGTEESKDGTYPLPDIALKYLRVHKKAGGV
jgi:hypothetical protein